jgi:hypothetical protein
MRAYIKRGAVALAAIGAVVATAVGASAMTLDCPQGEWQFKLGDATGAECYSGNDTNTIDGSFSMFGKTG